VRDKLTHDETEHPSISDTGNHICQGKFLGEWDHEDYAIFQVESFATPCDVHELCTTHAREIAQLLRAEQQVLSQQEASHVLARRISFGAADVVIIDEEDDVRVALEFANVELLEMRYLDRRLDDALDRS
jgi:hypothetical protein